MSEQNQVLNPVETMKADAIATVDVRDASAEGVALMRLRVENQKKMLAIAIGLTAPSQWTVFSGTGKDGVHRETIYPTGGAADTILRRAFGLTWGEKIVVIEEGKDGPEAVCVAWLMQGDRQVEQFEGRRRMGGFIKTEADMRKGAVENMKSVAVRDLLGLRFRTPTEIREMGLDVGKLERRAEFQNHGDDTGSAEATVGFGKNKGTPVSKLSEKQLEWYLDAAKGRLAELLADPEKKKWAPKERAWLNALEAEKTRRTSKPAASDEADFGPPALTEAQSRAAMQATRAPGEEG